MYIRLTIQEWPIFYHTFTRKQKNITAAVSPCIGKIPACKPKYPAIFTPFWNKSPRYAAQPIPPRKESIPIRSDIYELIALIARYWFAVVIVLFVIRAWRITIVDNRRAKVLRSFAASTGQLGELMVVRGAGRIRRGMRYPILQEGLLGASGKADIRIRNSAVKKRHAHFKITPEGLLLTSIAGAPLSFSDGNAGRRLLATDGDTLVFGEIHLLVVLFDGQTDQVHDRVSAPPPMPETYDEYDREYNAPYFLTDNPDDPFMLNQEDPWQEIDLRRKSSKRR